MSVTKSKVMQSVRGGIFGMMNTVINDQMLEEVEVLKHQGSLVTAVEGLVADLQQRVLEGNEVVRIVKSLLKGKGMSLRVKKTLSLQIIINMATYGAETWGSKRRCLNVFEMKCLETMVGVTR